VRWGILVNLAAIFLISGLLLFLVFCAALHRAVVDDAIEQASVLGDILQRDLRESRTAEAFWDVIKRSCLMRQGLRPLLYDAKGNVLGGCGVGAEVEKPASDATGRRVRVIVGAGPTAIFEETLVVVDATGGFQHGVHTVRGFFKAPSIVGSPAFQFFAAYLVFTQAALFFLGYVLFHRTVIGPVMNVARIAAQASGMTDLQSETDPARFKGDIQRISAGLQAMVSRIVEDRVRMQDLVDELRRTNDELRAAQESLIRSEKMASIGRLAAGLAHEIGNPLQIVMGYVEILKRRCPSDSEQDVTARMEQELKRIHEILHGMLEFARPAKEKRCLCDVNALVGGCGALLEGRKGFRSIVFEQELDTALAPLETEPEKLRQVMVNLIFNAADAVGEGGGKILLRTRAMDKGIEIQVKDSGRGISKEDLDKVFNPFFTTKEPGDGTGLGLSVCLAIVESLGGEIDIKSTEGQGTVVTVRLPA